jgi:cell division septum initiation protein DivIVA
VYQGGQDTYGNVARQIKDLQQQIHNMKTKVPNKNDLEQIQHMEANLDNLLKHEETWWAQRAKAN